MPSSFKLKEVRRIDETEERELLLRRKQRHSTKRAQASAKESLFREFEEEFQITPKVVKKRKPDDKWEFKRKSQLSVRLRTPMQEAYIKSLLKQPKLPKIPIKR